MNERIFELIQSQNGFRGLLWTEEDKQEFAELIVRECMKCSDPLIRHYIDKHPEQEQAFLLAAIADYSSEIKKHFGVE